MHNREIFQRSIETDTVTFDQDFCDNHADFKPRHFVLPAVSDNGSGMSEETILFIEDDTILQEMTRTMLNRPDYKVIPAKTPGEALRAAQNLVGNIDLIITDVVMPEMNGKELAALIQSTLPVDKLLYMSGCTANIIEQQCLLDAGTHFIEKPNFSGL
ncbi:MAG: response regulator [Deltaproteobacteria bacterium]|nr:response regulator [Deltaproteobacteria bacterium]